VGSHGLIDPEHGFWSQNLRKSGVAHTPTVIDVIKFSDHFAGRFAKQHGRAAAGSDRKGHAAST